MRLPLLCIIAAAWPQYAGAAFASTGSRRARLRSTVATAWPPMDLGLGAAGDLPSLVSTKQLSDVSLVPGEGGEMIEDEMAASQQAPATRSPPSPPRLLAGTAPAPPHKKPAHLLAALAKAQAKGLMVGAEIESDSTDDVSAFMVGNASSSEVDNKQKYIDEYDVTDDDDDEDDAPQGKSGEANTMEDLARAQSGDVEAVKHKPKKKKTLIRRAHRMAAAQTQTVKSNVAVKAVAVADQTAGDGKMMAQCMAYANWVKGQGSVGPDFVRLWKGTCMPNIMSGQATPQYTNMCDALGPAVGKFALKPWTPAQVCQVVLQVFNDAGIGATPLAG